jgi:putative ABC transport system permease protein
MLLSASPDYFRAIGIRTIAGRGFTPQDVASSEPVVILSETIARSFDPDPAHVIGLRLKSAYRGLPNAITVVGVVADVRLRGVTTPPTSQAYLPTTQAYPAGSLAIAIDPAGSPDRVIAAAKQALHEIDPELPIYSVIHLSELRAQYLATERLVVAMTGLFTAIALALCTIGLFGVLAQLVAQRTREIAIKMALGADRRRLRLGVVLTGIKIATAGVVIGVVTIASAWQTVAKLAAPIDTPQIGTIALDALVLVAAAVGAAWIPARRASAVDPMVALRE